jgi:hypothetical protein
LPDWWNNLDATFTYPGVGPTERDTLWHGDIAYMSNPPQYKYTTTDPNTGQFIQGRGTNVDDSGTWIYPPANSQDMVNMFLHNQMIDTGGEPYGPINMPDPNTIDMPIHPMPYISDEDLPHKDPVEMPTIPRRRGGPVNFYSGGGPLKYASYGTNELPDAWKPTGTIVYNEGAEEIANAATQDSMNTSQIVNSKLMEIEDPNRVGETGTQVSQGVTQAVKSSPGMTNFFQNVGDYGFKHGFESLRSPSNPFYQQSKMPGWLAKDIAQSGTSAMPNTNIVMNTGQELGQTFAQKPLEELTKEAVAESGSHLLDEVVLTGTKEAGKDVATTAATTAAQEGAKSYVSSVAPYSLVGSLVGQGIKLASDDQNPTTMNVGESIGTGLSGVASGAGIGSLFGPLGTVAGGLIGGAWSLLSGKKKRDDARDEVQEVYDEYVSKNAYTRDQARKIGKTYYGSDMGKRLRVKLGGIPYKYGGIKMKAYA